MPRYTVRKLDDPDQKEWDIICSYEELNQICKEYGLEKVLKPVGFITMHGGTLSRAGSEWRDVLGKIKKGAGRGNTIKT